MPNPSVSNTPRAMLTAGLILADAFVAGCSTSGNNYHANSTYPLEPGSMMGLPGYVGTSSYPSYGSSGAVSGTKYRSGIPRTSGSETDVWFANARP